MTSNYSVLENVAVEDDKFCVVKNSDNSKCIKFSLDNVDNERTISMPNSNETIGHPKAHNIAAGSDTVTISTTTGTIDLTPSSNVKITTGNLLMETDTSSIKLGADNDVVLEHVHNSGLILKGPTSPQLQFIDGNYYIKKDSSTLVLHGGTYASIQCNSSTAVTVAPNTGGGNNTITLINGATADNTYNLKVNGNSHITGYLGVTSFASIIGICYAASFSATSDDRLKENEVLITDATTTLKKLKPQTYLKKENMDTTDTSNATTESGLISQDIYYEAPELRHLITLADDASPSPSITIPSDPTQDPDYSSWGSEPSGINYAGLIAYLVKSIQELSARIDTLENP